MKRILMICLSLMGSQGCALMEDMVFGPDEDHRPYQSAGMPPAPVTSRGCAPPPAGLVQSQTQEPELLQVRR